MASRGGPRASGTDGSDFSHRERVASHYRESVRQKAKMKFCILIHMFFGVCVVGWMGLAISRAVKIAPDPWILLWLISVFPAIAGLSGLPKNQTKMMHVYSIGTMVTGIAPLMYGATFGIMQVMENFKRGHAPGTDDWRVLPMKMAMVAFVIQAHAVSIYYSNKLISAWNTKGEKSS
ncbi:predicted protein [Nematostella vectensis]|uniref:Uncharacterized protein n=1 Tax=Nematostella vectensis TaxID=45351 RepID=A7SVU8_NEMVE|nr:protein jagunal homolog 1 [Nematostella vectensis]EDO32175.1 predicted protein [Nematostella vectensis]|eukprot:XP_001624275.1 predicted protein [Nematostella vectensis]